MVTLVLGDDEREERLDGRIGHQADECDEHDVLLQLELLRLVAAATRAAQRQRRRMSIEEQVGDERPQRRYGVHERRVLARYQIVAQLDDFGHFRQAAFAVTAAAAAANADRFTSTPPNDDLKDKKINQLEIFLIVKLKV